MPPRDLGKRIARLREQRGLTQEALAERAGVHRVSLARIESGARGPSLNTLERLARALRVPVMRLLK